MPLLCRSSTTASQGRTFVTTLLSFGFELPCSIGGTALLVYVVKLRGPSGLLGITWAGGGFSLIEIVVLAAIIGCGNWARYAAEAQKRQEAARSDQDPMAVAPPVEPLVAEEGGSEERRDV